MDIGLTYFWRAEIAELDSGQRLESDKAIEYFDQVLGDRIAYAGFLIAYAGFLAKRRKDVLRYRAAAVDLRPRLRTTAKMPGSAASLCAGHFEYPLNVIPSQ